MASDAVWRVVMRHEPEPNDDIYVYATDAAHALTHGQEVYDILHPGNKRGAIYAELARHEIDHEIDGDANCDVEDVDDVDESPSPIAGCVHDWRQVEIDCQVCWHCGQSRIAIYSGWQPY